MLLLGFRVEGRCYWGLGLRVGIIGFWVLGRCSWGLVFRVGAINRVRALGNVSWNHSCFRPPCLASHQLLRSPDALFNIEMMEPKGPEP